MMVQLKPRVSVGATLACSACSTITFTSTCAARHVRRIVFAKSAERKSPHAERLTRCLTVPLHCMLERKFMVVKSSSVPVRLRKTVGDFVKGELGFEPGGVLDGSGQDGDFV